MPYTPETPGKDIAFDKPGIPSPAWNDEVSGSYSSGVYELIDSVTLNEDVYSLSISKKPNGEEYDFKAMAFIVNTKQGSSNTSLDFVAKNGHNELQLSAIKDCISTSGAKYGYCEFWQDKGIWKSQGCVAVDGYTSFVEQLTGTSIMDAFTVKISDYPVIDNIQIAAHAGGATIPKGTLIYIYGLVA